MIQEMRRSVICSVRIGLWVHSMFVCIYSKLVRFDWVIYGIGGKANSVDIFMYIYTYSFFFWWESRCLCTNATTNTRAPNMRCFCYVHSVTMWMSVVVFVVVGVDVSDDVYSSTLSVYTCKVIYMHIHTVHESIFFLFTLCSTFTVRTFSIQYFFLSFFFFYTFNFYFFFCLFPNFNFWISFFSFYAYVSMKKMLWMHYIFILIF